MCSVMENPLFSVLIANYNNAKYFEECFRSLQGQTYQNFEVIILDDGSTDDSLRVIQMLISNDHRFSLYKNDTNHGVGYTKNKLVALAQGDICGFVDGDDAIVEDAIQIMVNAHINFPEASIINSNLYFCDENLKILRENNVCKVHKDDYFFNWSADISHFATFKKIFYSKTEGINTYFKIAEDQDLYFKLLEVGEHEVVNNALYMYRCNPKSLVNTNRSKEILAFHWYAALRAAERRNLDVAKIISQNFLFNIEAEHIKRSKWARLGKSLGVFNEYKYLLNK